MSSTLIISLIIGYFLILITISWFTSKNTDSDTFFLANRQSPWYIVAFGMIGTSLSGVTFVSIPGMVQNAQFSYLQLVLGYLLGYFVIATVLMPLYYRLNLVSIYTYLEQRFGYWSYKTGAAFFMLSRTLGASIRLFLVAGVLQLAVFDDLGVPFAVSVMITIALIWVYTFRGGMKTIIWTDTFQTTAMLIAVVTTIWLISDELNMGFQGMIDSVQASDYSQVFFWDVKDSKYFLKQFFSGAFIAIVMTGLDQDMMQKNLSCKNIGEAQKNMFWFSIILVFVNMLFLTLGALLYIYANTKGITLPAKGDDVFPFLALNHFTPFLGIVFILGIIAITYASADSALTALTTSFCVDFLNFSERSEHERVRLRYIVHFGVSVVMVLVIIAFDILNSESVITAVFKVAGYTYGPLLGLYTFGLYTKRAIRDKYVPAICIVAPILTYIISYNSVEWLYGYEFGFEVLILNGFLTFVGLFAISSGKTDDLELAQEQA
ncbi:sodium:solute symporter [Pontibacter sp. BT310]|uniref:Sodium:solute symporter n=1 Tax=Pontibacter populi TaxID=890055 RepID=A0ABS6X749_9BACT|nr:MULTISPECIES: sodium:solute symporter [Pontibacter]MBJ6116969.1 sodium:solute symporter [Pontibacter sp. BT310]MBR0569393.1 sodium:solute symporter [Microvirga sp. STS03]MBW3363822.1 sodium:solute symporter [Pontibacter populi]